MISPAHLFLSAALAVDNQGEIRIAESLQRPQLAGTVVYLQCAELAPSPAVSNGLQLLYGI